MGNSPPEIKVADSPEIAVKFGSASSLGGTTLTGFTLATAQRLFSKPGQLDSINVAAKKGTSPQQLVDQIKPILPRDAQVRTGAQQAQTDTNSLDSSLVRDVRLPRAASGCISAKTKPASR